MARRPSGNRSSHRSGVADAAETPWAPACRPTRAVIGPEPTSHGLVARRHLALHGRSGVELPDRHDPFGTWERQRIQQHCIHDAEHRRRRADADGHPTSANPRDLERLRNAYFTSCTICSRRACRLASCRGRPSRIPASVRNSRWVSSSRSASRSRCVREKTYRRREMNSTSRERMIGLPSSLDVRRSQETTARRGRRRNGAASSHG